MISPFIINDKNLFLTRYPIAQVNRSLQAWDASDEYIINYVNENNCINKKTKVLIFNDAFGAIAVNFCGNGINQDNPAMIYCINDSYISAQGIQYNIEQNNLDNNITQLTSLDDLPDDLDLILFKIPKNKSLLIEQLIQIKNISTENTHFIATDKSKDIHSSTLKLFEKYLGTTKTSLAVKKARLVFCQFDNNQQHQSPFPTIWTLPNTDINREFIISNHANVYARDKLDIGARYFIENLPDVNEGSNVIDLGCGNGVIGLTVLAHQPKAHIQFFDESVMALASAKTNMLKNLPEQIQQCTFMLNDCLTDVESNSVDLILCNPPFHQHTATTDHIAWQMFRDSHRVLKKGGELRIIGNQKLAYHIKLKRLFGNEVLIASNDKFVTQSAIKR